MKMVVVNSVTLLPAGMDRERLSITQMSDDVRAERTQFTVNPPPAPSALSHPILQLTELATTLLMVLEKTKRARQRRNSSICPPAPPGPFSSSRTFAQPCSLVPLSLFIKIVLNVVSSGLKRCFSLSFVLQFKQFYVTNVLR